MTNKLMFACRTCQFSEEAISSCVFRNNMYNTVGETAGVTQDVGSDPTVCGFDFDLCCCWFCCTLCGVDLGDGGWDEGVGLEEEEEEENHDHGDKAVDVTVFDMRELSGLENEDEEMDGEPDTTGDDQDKHIPSHHGTEYGDAEGNRNGQSGFSLSPKPQSAIKIP